MIGSGRLAHVELLCPEFDESRRFFLDILGMLESERTPEASYLRCFGERAHHTLALRRAERPGLAHLGWGAGGAAGARNGAWTPSYVATPGHGAALRSSSPDGHQVELITTVQPAPPPERAPKMRNQPAPLRGRGVEPRRLAHVAVVADDPAASGAWWSQNLGLRERERVEGEDGTDALTLGTTAQPFDVLLLRAEPAARGGLHHVAFAVDHRDDLVYAADVLAEGGIRVESGIGQHGIGQLSYLYFFEPSGNRIALVNSPMLVLDNDWEPVTWRADERARALHWWGAPLPESYYSHHT